MKLKIANNQKKYKYLTDKFESDITLDLTKKSIVVFGPNGIGKSSITSYLLDTFANEDIEFLQYENNLSILKNKGNPLKLTAYISEIENKKIEIEKFRKNLEIKNEIKKKFGISNKTHDKKFTDEFSKNRIDDIFRGFNTKVSVLEDVIKSSSFIEPSVLIKHLDSLLEINDYIKEVDDHFLEMKSKLLKNALSLIELDTNICPVCGQSHDDLYSFIEIEYNKIKNVKSKVNRS